MKLEDLHEERVNDYVKRLVRGLKIKTLGSGAFSTVFQHPVYHNVSVKITRDADPHYILWLREAEKRQHNPWFPKIVGIHKVMFHGDDVDRKMLARDEQGDAALEGRHIVFMQKLRPMKNVENKKTTQYIVRQLPDKLFMTDEDELAINRLARGLGKRREMLRKLERRGVRYFQPRDSYTSIDSLEDEMWDDVVKYSQDKNLVELAQVLIKIGTDDLHSGNIMMRDDGGAVHPVITDPVAS